MTKKINKSPTAEIKQIPKNVKRGKTKIKTIIHRKKCLKDTRATRGSVKFTCHRLKRRPKRNRKGCWRQLELIGIARNLDAIQLGSYKAQLWTHCFHGSLEEGPICSHDCLWAHCQSSHRCCNSCSHFWGILETLYLWVYLPLFSDSWIYFYAARRNSLLCYYWEDNMLVICGCFVWVLQLCFLASGFVNKVFTIQTSIIGECDIDPRVFSDSPKKKRIKNISFQLILFQGLGKWLKLKKKKKKH